MKTAMEWAEEINTVANEQGGFDTVDDMEEWLIKVQNDSIRECKAIVEARCKGSINLINVEETLLARMSKLMRDE